VSAAGIVAAAGRGTRFGADRNKVFLPLLGVPLLRRSLQALAASGAIDRIIVAVAPRGEPEVATLTQALPVPCLLVPGGATRQQSVRNALSVVDEDLVAVHDAARPLVSSDTIRRCLESARSDGTGIAAVRVTDSLKRAPHGTVTASVPRDDIWATQTPQCARTEWLRKAYEVADADGFEATDEASLLEHAGFEVRLVEAAKDNLKVTTPEDLPLAEAVLRSRVVSVPRVGYGYDVHRFAAGRRMVLGGVDFGLDYGPDGHSDADVVLHAVMDAVLGAAGLPDIGALFPNTDERWRGADSAALLVEVRRRAGAAGFAVGNVDITVIAERPKIAPHVAAMKSRIAALLGIPEDAVGIKATTAEGLGDLGRGNGLAAHAVCVLVGVEP
jgi:2-C-methyl-D-erythritol 4-phosphate cytidylyltransferase/2-C-methyl-D-erythritol 2,4-cyclodiphosphate synthase